MSPNSAVRCAVTSSGRRIRRRPPAKRRSTRVYESSKKRVESVTACSAGGCEALCTWGSRMLRSTRKPIPITNRVFTAFAASSVIGGMAATFALVVVGFEEPNIPLLLVSGGLALATPGAVLLHVIFTRELTWPEKRAWVHELCGSRAPRVFSAYLTCRDRRAFARHLVASRH
jgi:hypothetical protein